jgi:hypothetical protein
MHINPDLLESELTTPLLRPSVEGPLWCLFNVVTLDGYVVWILTDSIVGTTKFQFYGPELVVPHNFAQFCHTNFYGSVVVSVTVRSDVQ